MKRPVIGISMNVMRDRDGIMPNYPRAYVNHDYVRSVLEAGGLPYLIPVNTEEGTAEEYLSHVDGLILTGGQDVDPHRYGEEPRQKIGEVFPDRDAFDLNLLEKALALKLPILGICRGFQIINVSFGGKLLQDLSYSEKELFKHMQGHTSDLATHLIDVKAGTRFAQLLGEEIMINSFHHQTVIEPGEGLTVAATAKDGTIEAVEDSKRNIMATQWHPEMMSANSPEMMGLFKDLIQRAKDKDKEK